MPNITASPTTLATLIKHWHADAVHPDELDSTTLAPPAMVDVASGKVVDFMEIAVVALFLAQGSIFDKADTLCEWFEYFSNENSASLQRDMFQLWYKSIDAGLCKCLGYKPLSDKDCIETAERLWLHICGMNRARDTLPIAEFKDNCVRKNSVIRHELEFFANCQLRESDTFDKLAEMEVK